MFSFDYNFNELVKKSITKTLGELNHLKSNMIDEDNDEFFHPIEYIEGSKESDVFIFSENVINPQNVQHLISAWIPLNIAKELYFDYLTADTDKYCNWTSAYVKDVAKKEFKTEQEALDCVSEFINALRNNIFHGEFAFTTSVEIKEYSRKNEAYYSPRIEFSYV